MSDYIKREDAIKAMARGLGIPYTDFIDVAERCMDDIQNADVVEVVRCKDCKHGSWCEDVLWCNVTDEPMPENDYCSYGKRADS